MSLPNNVVQLNTRAKLKEAATALANNARDIDNYHNVLAAVGEIFSNTFGVDCHVQITVPNKEALVKSLEQKQ